MRTWLQTWGVKIRRFPLWLQIFNTLSALTLLSIAVAGFYFLLPQRKKTTGLLVEGRLNRPYVSSLLKQGKRQQLALEIKALPIKNHETLVSEIGAFCEALTGALLLECAEHDVARDASLTAFERWREAYKDCPGFPEGADSFEIWIRAFKEPGRTRRLAAESIIFGNALARSMALDSLIKLKDKESSALLLYVLRVPNIEHNLRYRALNCLEEYFGKTEPTQHWSQKLLHFQAQVPSLPPELRIADWNQRIEQGLYSDNIDEQRAAFSSLSLIGKVATASSLKLHLEEAQSLPKQMVRALFLSGESREQLENIWQQAQGSTLEQALLLAAEYPDKKPGGQALARIKTVVESEELPHFSKLQAAWLIARLSWDEEACKSEFEAQLMRRQGHSLGRLMLLRNLICVPEAAASSLLSKVIKDHPEEPMRELARRRLRDIQRKSSNE
jgi:hypothetical protein